MLHIDSMETAKRPGLCPSCLLKYFAYFMYHSHINGLLSQFSSHPKSLKSLVEDDSRPGSTG